MSANAREILPSRESEDGVSNMDHSNPVVVERYGVQPKSSSIVGEALLENATEQLR
jgi:hypothetical protein